MEKIDKIHSLSLNELKDTVYNLANRLGYKDLFKGDDIIIGFIESPLSTDKYLFIIFLEKLSGISNTDSYKERILELQRQHLANTIFIISSFNISSGFDKSLSSSLSNLKLDFIDRDRLINLINDYYPDFWKHDDLMLIEYEKQFCDNSNKDIDLKKLKIFNEKYLKLLEIYIEPRLYFFYEDKKTQTPTRKRVTIEDIIKDTKPIVLSGDAGTGKSTLLKKIGEKLIDNNLLDKTKNVPVFITVTEIFENEYKIADLVSKKIKASFLNIGLTEFFKNYEITILVDSIDELEKDKQISILEELNRLVATFNIKYIIGTRNYERIISLSDRSAFSIYTIEKFNTDQIKKFVTRFFIGASEKADNLIDALKENRIIERLPITPLTLSLISILYEENNLEIPATIADIYDNFNSLIIGRSTATSRFEFIDISFKERILTLYALHLLEKSQHTPLSKDEFFNFFLEYFKGKTLPIKKGNLEEVLEYLIDNTGVLVLKDNKWVQFSHDSYMEYYGALEIFKHQRGKESLLVENFFENNWQNAAIFYAGKSKDLPDFLRSIIDRLKSAKILSDFFMGVLGCGYLLQALYQTDNMLRKEAVLESLNLNVKAYDTILKLAADDIWLFRNFRLPILQLVNLMYFYETFNSFAVKEPLLLAFRDIYDSFKKNQESVNGYKAIKLAITLDSKRLKESGPLSEVIDDQIVFNDPALYLLVDFTLGYFETEKYNIMKRELKKEYQFKLKNPIKSLIELPANRLRFSNLDTITASKEIRIIVEGKTDAEIIEHAYYTLTDGNHPYWKINQAGNESGGASEVAKTLLSSKAFSEKSHFIIGIFDHDAKGLQEFRGLKKEVFSVVINDTLKKHVDCNIYALTIPVPGDLDYYLQKDQQFNFFEIEHYFDSNFLFENKILEETPIPKIFKIKDSKKKEFSKHVRTLNQPEIFKNFLELFKQIDNITNASIDYVI